MDKPPNSDDRRPIPDPTVLTTEALHREISSLHDLLLREIEHLGEVMNVKFETVDKGFAGMADRTAEQKLDTKAALDAALRSASDAVALQTVASDRAIAKSEAATTKQIDALAVALQKAVDALEGRITDAKENTNKLEIRVGKQEQTKTTQTDTSARQLAVLAVVVSILVLVAMVVNLVRS